MDPQELDALAREHDFSGVVRIDRGGDTLARAYGRADRRHGIAMTVDSQLATASGTKGFTALTVMSLVAEGRLTLDTTARHVLGADLPLIADDVTVEHLLAHRSGIGDYLDEDELEDDDQYLMPLSAHVYDTTEAFLPWLDGHPTKFPAGERFTYCNGGFMVLALIAERVGGAGFHDLVHDRVLKPAGLVDTDFLRSDELPGRAALGYVGPTRTNVFHLPVRGNGDGGIYTTVADLRRFWTALFAGDVVPPGVVADMIRPHFGDDPYGLGFWLKDGDVRVVGGDAGVSMASRHDPATGDTTTVISNVSDGAWAVWKAITR